MGRAPRMLAGLRFANEDAETWERFEDAVEAVLRFRPALPKKPNRGKRRKAVSANKSRRAKARGGKVHEAGKAR